MIDALPGLAQQIVPEKAPLEGKNAGHGCGHHLFGAASVAAGIEMLGDRKPALNYRD